MSVAKSLLLGARELAHRFTARLVTGEDQEAQQERTDPIDSDVILAQARDEWVKAQQYFNSVSDPELIDHAVYQMSAAERKYMYLWRALRRERPPEDVKSRQAATED